MGDPARTDLDDVRGQDSPRSPELVGRLGSRLVPIWGFLAYGCLYVIVAAMAGTAKSLFDAVIKYGDLTDTRSSVVSSACSSALRSAPPLPPPAGPSGLMS